VPASLTHGALSRRARAGAEGAARAAPRD
jgi:hypothetical protein